MVKLVALYGVGDAYLVCSLTKAFEATHGLKARVVVKEQHAAIPEWFELDYEVDDMLIYTAENGSMRYTYENDFRCQGVCFVHPHFVKTLTRLDQLTIKPRVSQADMYRALLRLHPYAPTETPKLGRTLWEDEKQIVVIPRSRSWPNLSPAFWGHLIQAFQGKAFVSESCSLSELLDRCAQARVIIGPQCGVMSIACEAGFPAAKIFVIKALSEQCPYLFGLKETMPYGRTATFAGHEYNVDYLVLDDTCNYSTIKQLADLAVGYATI